MEDAAKQLLTSKWALHQLRDQILHYWSDHMIDGQFGGFLGRIDGRNEAQPLADKGVILNARILWTFSAAYRQLLDGQYLELADRAYDYLVEHFQDREHGGVYWMVDHTGRPVETKKQVYAQAFVIYGLSEYYQVRPDRPEVLEWAMALFHLLEDRAFDAERNGYIEALDRGWQPLEDVRLSEKDLNAAKTMNTHLHVLEAYTNLYRTSQEPLLTKQLQNLIELMVDRFVDGNYHFRLFFDEQWNLLSDEFSYGHDIEGSWLLVEAAEVLDDSHLVKKTRQWALKMVHAALEGLDGDGGLMNEGNPQGFTDTNKDWWPQAEALVGLVNAWQIDGNVTHLKKAEAIATFIDKRLVDPVGGWHWGVTRDGIPRRDEDKAGPWKCPYHNGRAMLELLRRLP